MDVLFFWFFSIAMLGAGLAVILSRNAVTSALCFVGSIFCMAALFVMLSAFFLAAVQILVTAGAVMVLFLFIIMLLDLTAMEHVPRQKIWMGCALVLGLGFIYLVALTLKETPRGFVTQNSLKPAGQTVVIQPQVLPDGSVVGQQVGVDNGDKQDDLHRIGHLLFTTYVAPFEITSLLILVATVGVIVLCKQEPARRPGPRESITHEAPPLGSKKESALKN